MSDPSAPQPPAAQVLPLRLPPASPLPRRIRRVLTALVVLAVALAAVSIWAYHTQPQRVDGQRTVVVGQTQLAPGRENLMRVVVSDAQEQKPVANALVKVSLAPQGGGRPVNLFSGRSGSDGSLVASLPVAASASPTQTLIVETRSGAGRDRVTQPVTVRRSYKLLLTTDKPVYQPGQTVHRRALAFSTLDMQAALEADIAFLVEDPKGNKVFRRTVRSSAFGVAAADFALADEVTNGDYKVTASLGDTSSEKTVSVRPYVLPKFAVKVATERSYYLPGQRVAGTVQCDYFFGKPTAGARVEIAGSVFDVQKTEVARVQGQTDERGTYRFAFDLPRYFAGRGLESDQAELSLQVSVVDQAEHTEQASAVLPIAADPIIIEVVAEAGVLKPGVENRLYILTSYPDGSPARTRLDLTVGDRAASLTTGDYGLAEHTLVPSTGPLRLTVRAVDGQGQSGEKTLELQPARGPASILLRPDRATYRLGDTMRLVVLSSQSYGSVFLDLVKDGQTLSTRSTPMEGGRAEFAIDLGGDLYGTLVLHAYRVELDGSLVRDTRLVVVDAPRDLATDIQAARAVYRPGETARVSLHTQDAAGPVRAALGVAVVDESVFAVMEQDPGFARLYFLLQKELLEPKYQIKGFTLPEVLTSTVDSALRTVQDQAARAAWAGAGAGAPPLQVDSRPLKIEAARLLRLVGLTRVTNGVVVALSVVPAARWGVALLGLLATGVLGRALGRLGLTVLAGAFGAPFACLGFMAFAVLFHDLAGLLVVGLVVGWLVAAGALTVQVWSGRDERARIVWVLLAAWVALGVVLSVALSLRAVPGQNLALAAVVAYLAGLLALLFFAGGLHLEGRRSVAAALYAVVLLFVPAVIAAAMVPQVVRYARVVETLGNPLVYTGPAGWLAGCTPEPAGRSGQLLPLFGDRMPFSVAAPTPTFTEKAEAPGERDQAKPQAGEQAPRLRQFFPETLLWVSELYTDGNGFVSLDVPLADSITTWRVTALASTQDGQLGYANAGLRVFQDFFVDVDLPVALTQNDEVSISVAVYNYLPEAQSVRLVVAEEAWFELQDEAVKSVRIAANDIDVAYFRIRVRQFGDQAFQVTAWGERMSDAIRRPVAVVPDGREVRLTSSDWLSERTVITATLPVEAIAGTQRIGVKVYPGAISQVVEGLEKILRLPFG